MNQGINNNIKLLIVDDEPFQLEYTRSLLDKLGVQHIEIAQSAKQAIEILKTGMSPDIIILDLEMPEIDGVEFIREEANQLFKGDIILVSGVDSSILKVATRLTIELGLKVLGTLAKPINKSDLAIAMSRFSYTTQGVCVKNKDELMTVDELKQAILSTSVELAKAFYLDIVAVAEGVETQEEWDLVAERGCDYVQGYFVAKPMPADDFI